MNADNGSAIFGKQGPGQIIIDPSQKKALLFSYNYFDSYGEDGLPTNYNDPSVDKTKDGMLIDLSTPCIKFRSGKFRLDKNGSVTASDGIIGGWTITDDKITSGNTILNSDGSIQIGNNFSVSTTGILTAASANISGSIATNNINITLSSDSTGGLRFLDSKGKISSYFSYDSQGTHLVAYAGADYNFLNLSAERIYLETEANGLYLNGQHLSPVAIFG